MRNPEMSALLTARQLAEYVDLVQPCYYHNLDNWAVIRQHANEVLEWFDCPAAWRPVVRVMAQGADYYGEEDWNKGA